MNVEKSSTTNYLAERGIVPIRKRREDILHLLPDGPRKQNVLKRLADTEDSLNRFEAGVRALPEVQRLHRLSQLGGKNIQLRVEYNPDEGRVRMPAFHTRYNHSELDAELAKIACLYLDFPFRTVELAMLGGWWHDLGHSAFSHTGDELLKAAGRLAHEGRTVEMIKNSTAIKQFLAESFEDEAVENVVYDIAAIIAEHSFLGKLQSIFDTLSYLIVDRAMIHQEKHEELAANIFHDLIGVDEQEQLLVFNSTKNLQEFMELRATWMAELCNRPNKRTDEALRGMLRLAVEHGVITLDDIEIGVDNMVKLRLQADIEKMPVLEQFLNLPAHHMPRLIPYHRLYQLMQGFYDTREWDMKECATHEEVKEYVEHERQADPSNAVRFEQVVILEPFDYSKKQLPVMVEVDGVREKRVVRAEQTKLGPDDTLYFVYIPKS